MPSLTRHRNRLYATLLIGTLLGLALWGCTLLPTSSPSAQAPRATSTATARASSTPRQRAPTARPQPTSRTRTPTARPQPTARPSVATPAPQPTPRATKPIAGFDTTTPDQLPSQARHTLALIAQGGPFPYRQDGAVFQNRERVLPRQASGYYHEYTVETPGSDDRGARRIITGAAGEIFYTADHYATFVQVLPS